MPEAPLILLVDSSASDIELARTVLVRALPTARFAAVTGPGELLDALNGPAVELAVVSPKLNWGDADKVMQLIARELPGAALIVFGHEHDIVRACLEPARALAGVVRKSSAGFLALGDVVQRTLRSIPVTRGLELEDLGLPAFYATAEGRLASVNTAFAALAGLERESVSRTPLDALCADEQAARTWLAYAAGEVGEVNLNLRFSNGTNRAAHVRRDPARPPERRFLGLVTEAASAEVNIVNAGGRDGAAQEMEDVALVFSHDLKEPLQQIMRIARRLEQRGRSTPGEDERLVGKLFTCADRASSMVDAMVEYLAVSSRDEPTDLVDLNQCLEEALGNLRASLDESETEVIAEQLPSIAGDAYQIVHLFQNIVANAIKFRGRARPELRISASTSGRFWRLVFRDNGIGIAAPFRESVFEIGKRLHTRDEYPGSGIGLTMCRRICERHGGSIHIEPDEGGGTAVVIELPRTPSHITRLA